MIVYVYVLKDCTYCELAERYFQELTQEDETFASMPVVYIDSEDESCGNTDCYVFPCIVAGGEKLHEGPVSKEGLAEILRRAIDK